MKKIKKKTKKKKKKFFFFFFGVEIPRQIIVKSASDAEIPLPRKNRGSSNYNLQLKGHLQGGPPFYFNHFNLLLYLGPRPLPPPPPPTSFLKFLDQPQNLGWQLAMYYIIFIRPL